jgi:nicotinate phosphoribosyltransferase
MKKNRLQMATEKEIRQGLTTDVYFERTVHVLKRMKASKRVKAEFTVKSLPPGYGWGIFTGLEECLSLLEGVGVDVRAIPEGTVIRAREPVLTIEGDYVDFARLETPLLGFLCQASGVATKAARLRIAAGDRALISFGARRMHPAVSPVIERNAFVGGCDGVATVKAAGLLGIEPSGTIPHALVILAGGIDEALLGFDRFVDKEVRRIALVDTFGDEKFEALAACTALGKRLDAVRLDTPGSRRGNMRQIVGEVRWEMDLRGYSGVGIIVSGGLDEAEILELRDLVDGFGVGTSLSNSPVLDFAMDIVEVDGEPRAKRGKESGGKRLLRCSKCGEDYVVPARRRSKKRCGCGGRLVDLTVEYMTAGKMCRRPDTPRRIRQRVIAGVRGLRLS